jgi:branched-chain amino acid transport system substrate-binding protein
MLRPIALAAFIAACLPISAALAQEKPPIKFGNIAIMSGPAASSGNMEKAVVDVAVEDINAAGGINGSKVIEQTEDAQLDPGQAVLMYRKLAAENAVGVIGPVTGTQWQTVAPIAQQVKLPAATANAVASGITVRPWTIRLEPPDDVIIPQAVELFLKKFPAVKKVAIFADSGESSTLNAANLFKSLAKKNNLEVVGETIGFTGKTMDLSPAAIEIKRLDPDALWGSALPPQQLLLAKALVAQGFDKPKLANNIFWPGNFVSTVGEAGKGWYVPGFSTNDKVMGDNARYQSVSKRIIERVSKIPGTGTNISQATIAYDTAMVYADILRKAGVDGNTPILQAREKLKDGFVSLKEYSGLNVYKIMPDGDGDVKQALIIVDVPTGQWKFAD